MRLKQIKLAGFKSFVDPTTVPFPASMTAIVGPNGCGKSNIIDAVRWVLGESSAKNLRGDAMTDVIFNGSTARKPVSQASIELVFDNSEGRLQGEYAKYTDIAVKRIVTRDAVSTYLINGSKCRKKDITELFLGTGLGPRSYAIIEQGMISRLIESKPQELRLFIEEAAGISKYKERRRETENRIRHTRDNLERLDDLRAELQQQLEKLQRQASAAKRYKDLKARERKLKAEYSALRWLRMNGQTERLDADISQKNLALEQLLSQHQGDEGEMQTHKTKQAEFKHKLEQINQTLFKIGQAITKEEQTQFHLKEKKQNLIRQQATHEAELTQLKAQNTELEEQKAALEETLEFNLPELEIIEQAQDEAQIALDDAETQQKQELAKWQADSEQYFKSDSELKANQHQIISLTRLIERGQLQIDKLSNELKASDGEDGESIDGLFEQLENDKLAFKMCQEALQTLGDQLVHSKQALNELEKSKVALQAQYHQLKAKQTSLSTLIENQQPCSEDELITFLSSLGYDDVSSIYDAIEVEPEWACAVEHVLNTQTQHIISKSDSKPINEDISNSPAQIKLYHSQNESLHSSNQMPYHADSLAQFVKGPEHIRQLFSNVLVKGHLSELTSNQSIINQQGVWIGHQFSYIPSGKVENRLSLLADLKAVDAEISVVEQKLETMSADIIEKQTDVERITQNYKLKEQDQAAHKVQITNLEHKISIEQEQQQRAAKKRQQLQQEVSDTRETIELELAQKMELEEQAIELSATLQTYQAQQDATRNTKAKGEQKIQALRSQLESVKNQKHSLVLTIEQDKNKLQSCAQHLKQVLQRLDTKHAQVQQGNEELTEVDFPLEDSAIQLQENILFKQETEQERALIADQLIDVEQLIADLEKGQHGVFTKAEKLKEQIAALKIEREGYNVRAIAVLDVLKELDVNLKTVLDELSDDADEDTWQQDLEKTTLSINRLGAINLAAIEEYDHQSERKTYLDAQNIDLVNALDTLEEAIRKIDKETKAKFKETFDTVNHGLQTLFPKVFGGGSAYLDLTGEDLLDTGVTIMARPPGKRNSTIHLLSGGEKALTALSLVFSIFKLNPAPFCMLDEVDAPLDDANVGRFCRLVKEMSDTVQFVFISHNKIAMEMADNLVGVTMQEPGVSRMVAVDMEKAIELAEI
ncbi:chromosome segregation protein SMC [Catenovulum sp. SM1970]|uniref:chromosome segregation protein SMC n=1 Tax=Marinifaba aquimaris TaxID=2741323 RepID=UPI001571B330|nr:chromosome segregation protein SMC [Marinifaba aquimaris]NTS77369.1 chromosome segregation protein SMC [Marinifaba aquimaris]